MKDIVKRFWEGSPCGAADTSFEEGTLAFFEDVERQRYSGDYFMADVVGFDRWKGQTVLEVGCGLGTDLLQFARGGAHVHGVDLTSRGAALTRKRLALYGFQGHVVVADGEHLPFRSGHFDLVYSWGVVHHTADPPAMVRELVRVCRPGGHVLTMVYHRCSLVALQMWLFYGLLRGRPFVSTRRLIAERMESPGTRAYTPEEALQLFSDLDDVEIETIVTRFDVRVWRRRFLPPWVRGLVPRRWGWFMVVRGVAPERRPS